MKLPGKRLERGGGLTERVEATLRRKIERAGPGEKLPPERELAGCLGVSIVKVREALTLLAREGLVERSHGRGTFVCEPPVRQWTAVVLIHDLAHPTLSFFERRVFQSLRRRLNAAGVPSRGYAAFGDPAKYEQLDCPEFFQDLEAGRVRHVVPVGGDLPAEVLIQLDRREIGRTLHEGMESVEQQRAMVRAGIRYLLSHGRRRLALLAWVDPRMPDADRKPACCAAFEEELRMAELPRREEWIKCDLHPNLPGAGWQEFRDFWRHRGDRDRPDGLLIANDILAGDAAIAVAESGIRVPEELLIVTHENRGSGQWFPFPVARMQTDPDRHAATLAHRTQQALGAEPRPVEDEGPAWCLVPIPDLKPEPLPLPVHSSPGTP